MAETALAPNPYGFHIAEGGGNQDGIGEHWTALDSAGKIVTLKSVGNIGDCNTVARLARASGLPHIIVLRLKGKDNELELPNYDNPPEIEGPRHLNKVIDALPVGFDDDGNLRFEIDYIWLEIINEPDEDRAEWVWQFMYYAGLEAIRKGYKLCGPGWSAGTPREMSWQTAACYNFLKLCQDNPNQIAVATHEYSYNINDIYDGIETMPDGSVRYWKIGRFHHIIAACDAFGLKYPKILITEWGWELWNVPAPWLAIQHINSTFDMLYDEYPGVVVMAAIWYLGPDFKNIANKAQKLIAPTTTWILANTGPPVPGNGNGEPPGECIETDITSKRIQLLRPRHLTDVQKAWLDDAMTVGLDVYGTGDLQPIGTEGWAHTDIMKGIRDAVEAGYPDSRLVVMDGHLIGDGLDQDWMEENCPLLLGHTVWFTVTDQPPAEFAYEVWPSDHRPEYVTQHFGANPANYKQFGMPGHGGTDIRAPHGTVLRCVADGEVYRVEHDPSVHNFGIHVRVKHAGVERTIYAHLAAIDGGIFVGAQVSAGQILGTADNTGYSFGSHLHFARKRAGEIYVDPAGNAWPYDLWDPSPLLAPLAPHLFDDPPPPPPPPTGKALFGLHMSADPGDLRAPDYDMARDSRPEVIKVLSAHGGPSIARLSTEHPQAIFIIRAFLKMEGRDISPEQFLTDTLSDTTRAINHLPSGNEYIVELHNEPNLVQEGLGTSWANGAEFNNWLMQVLDLYQDALPDTEFMYPGLSPGPTGGGRQYHGEFLQQSAEVLARFTHLGVHAYWASEQGTAYPMSTALAHIDSHIITYPDKAIWSTESCNNRPETAEKKAEQYILFWNELLKRPTVHGVTYYVTSASNPEWGWGPGGTGQVWEGTNIAQLVGQR